MATPIPGHLRSAYLDAVASALTGVSDPGDGEIHRAARTAQQKILYGSRRSDGPTLDGKTGMPIMSPRQHAEAMGIKETNGDIGVTIIGARGKCSMSNLIQLEREPPWRSVGVASTARRRCNRYKAVG